MKAGRLAHGAIGAALALCGCVDSNITGNRPRGEGEGIILFASNRAANNFEIHRVTTNGADVRRLTQDEVNNDLSPAGSRDGQLVAWEKEIVAPDGSITSVEIWVMSIDGSAPRPVVMNGSENRNPSWALDDAALVYESRASGNSEIMRIDLADGSVVNLTNSPFADQYPRVSPEGSRILFQSNRDLNFEIYVMNADGSSPRNLTANAADDRFASWTPDGESIVWSRFTDSFDIFQMDATGGNQRVLLGSPFEETKPSVAPDGAFLVYQTNRFPRSSLDVAALTGTGDRALTGSATRPSVSDVGPWWAVPLP